MRQAIILVRIVWMHNNLLFCSMLDPMLLILVPVGISILSGFLGCDHLLRDLGDPFIVDVYWGIPHWPSPTKGSTTYIS